MQRPQVAVVERRAGSQLAERGWVAASGLSRLFSGDCKLLRSSPRLHAMHNSPGPQARLSKY